MNVVSVTCIATNALQLTKLHRVVYDHCPLAKPSVIFVLIYFLVLVLVLVLPTTNADEDVLMICLNAVHC